MIFYSLLTTIIVSIIFFVRKSITWAVFTFIGMIMFYLLFVKKILPQVIIDNVLVGDLARLISAILLIVFTKFVMDKYLNNEVGLDLADLISTIFPDRRLKLFVLFFVGQLAFSQLFFINILLIYFIGKILRIDAILIMIVGIISLTIASLFDASFMLQFQEYPANADYILSNNLTKVFLIVSMVVAFLSLFVSILFIKDDVNDDFLDIIKKDWLPYLIIIASYVILFLFTTAFTSINQAQSIVSFIMFAIISVVSVKLMKHTHEPMNNEDKKYPFIFSIFIFIINALILLFANVYLILATILFALFNYYVLKKYEAREENVLQVNLDSKFLYKLIGLGIFIYVFYILVVNSDINNTSLNTSIMDSIITSFNSLNSPFEIFVFFFSLAPMCIVLPLKELTELTTSVVNDFLIFNLFAIFSTFNIITFYVLHDLLGIEDIEAINGYFAILAFNVLLGLIITCIAIIGG